MGDRGRNASAYLSTVNHDWKDNNKGFNFSGWVDQGIELMRTRRVPQEWDQIVEAWEFFQAHQAQKVLGLVRASE